MDRSRAGDDLYFYDANYEEIDRIPIAGGTVTTLVRNVYPDSFCLANGHIYFTEEVTATQAALMSISLDAQASPVVDGGTDGGTDALVTLATNNSGLRGPCFEGGNLYYVDNGSVMRIPAEGGAATVFPGPAGATAMAPIETAGGHLYWATGDHYCPNITRAAMDGSGLTTLVHAIESPTAFALNATHLFILTSARQILRVPL